MAKQNIYDNKDFYEHFLNIRSEKINYNDCVESPILRSMLPDMNNKNVLDIGCGMGQHVKEYSEAGAASVTGIDISEKMLAYAKAHNSADNITYLQMPMESISDLGQKFDLITSSLAFDYAENMTTLLKDIFNLLTENGQLVFSMSHPMTTTWDGIYDQFTFNEKGEHLYANMRNYMVEGRRSIPWASVDNYELYHRTFSSLINAIICAGFTIEECQESCVPDELRTQHSTMFGGTIHRPDFVFFRCRK